MMINIIYTRLDYMFNKCTHEQYYNQFTNNADCEMIAEIIGHKRLMANRDDLNRIPLVVWDNYPSLYDNRLRSADDIASIAGRVCLLKAAARKWIAQQI